MATLTEDYRIETLAESVASDNELERLQIALEDEWGSFAPADMREMRQMVGTAGHMMYVIRFSENGNRGEVSGILQTALADVHGDPQRLLDIYPTFNHITSNGTWDEAKRMEGDTALLLQITAFGGKPRTGSLLRDGALPMLPRSVSYALTTSPFDGVYNSKILETPVERSTIQQHFTRVMMFHYLAGAVPAGYMEKYKVPDPSRPNIGKGRQHNPNVVFMRYARLPDGSWKGR